MHAAQNRTNHPTSGDLNTTAVNNDDGKPGEFLAEPCREAGGRLRELTTPLVEGVLGRTHLLEGTEGSTPRALRQKDDGISSKADRSTLLSKPDGVTGRQKARKIKVSLIPLQTERASKNAENVRSLAGPGPGPF